MTMDDDDDVRAFKGRRQPRLMYEAAVGWR